MSERRQEDLLFRTLAAPGLDEDDLFAALHGLPGPVGPPGARMPDDGPWSEARERRRRHERLLRKWEPASGPPPAR